MSLESVAIALLTVNRATPASGSEVNRGGIVKIGGYTVTIPANLLVEFPALMVPFAEFALAGSGGRAPVVNEVSVCSLHSVVTLLTNLTRSMETSSTEISSQVKWPFLNSTLPAPLGSFKV